MAFDPTDEEGFLEIWRSLFPGSYTRPIQEQANGQGLDVYAQQAAQFARVSEAIAVTTQAVYVLPHSSQVAPPAAGARAATGEVVVRRAAPASGELTLVAGVEVVVRGPDTNGTVLDGVVFLVAADTVLPDGSGGPVTVPVVAARVGYQGNVMAGSITAFLERGRAEIEGEITAGNVHTDNGAPDRWSPRMIGQYVRIVSGPNAGTTPRRVLDVTQGATWFAVLSGPALTPGDAVVEVEEFEDLGLTVEQPAATEGGRHGFLDAIGADRETPRVAGEDDESYRQRVAAFADVVSPGAINRIVARALTPLGISWALEETRDPLGLRGFIWDYDPFDAGSIADGNVLLDESTAVRFYIVRIGIGGQGEFGFAWDAVGPGLANAWDAEVAAGNFFDGYPYLYNAAVAALIESLRAATEYGVRFIVVRDPSL